MKMRRIGDNRRRREKIRNCVRVNMRLLKEKVKDTQRRKEHGQKRDDAILEDIKKI